MIHGYSTSFDAEGGMLSTWARVVSKSLDSNLVVVDWSELAFDNYGCLVHETVPAVADFLARSIYTLFDHGVRPESIVFGGHGLGAHIGGLTADQIRPKPKSIVGTIDNQFIINFSRRRSEWFVPAFDPAGPYYSTHAVPGLRPDSCKTVYVLHTNDALFGNANELGTVDVFANGGFFQPGCSPVTSVCSHFRAVAYDIASRENEGEFFVTSSQGRYDLVDLDIPKGRYVMKTGECDPFIKRKSRMWTWERINDFQISSFKSKPDFLTPKMSTRYRLALAGWLHCSPYRSTEVYFQVHSLNCKRTWIHKCLCERK